MTNPTRLMLESNVHDLVAADPAVRAAIVSGINSGRLTLISAHIQRDELTRAPEAKREGLLDVYRLAEIEKTTGAVWDVSR
jgi:hypothetical protein